jgi:hypothetical protein
MRLFEIKLEKKVPTPREETEARNTLNIIEEDEQLYSQIRTELNASYRETNQKYFDQTKQRMNLRGKEPEEYFNKFQFPNQEALPGLGDEISISYLPGTRKGYERRIRQSSSYPTHKVPFLEDLMDLGNSRIHSERIFEQVENSVTPEGITQKDFADWINDAEPPIYEYLLRNFQDLPESEEIFRRDVVDERRDQKEAFVQYIVKETLYKQQQQYDQVGPNNLPKEDVLEELPDYKHIKDDLTYSEGKSHLEKTLIDPLGQNLIRYLEGEQDQREAEALKRHSRDSEEHGNPDQSEDANILEQSGLNSVEGILTAKPEEVARFIEETR